MVPKLINIAIKRFLDEDSSLLQGEAAKEECISHRLALYIHEAIIYNINDDFIPLRTDIKSGKIKIDTEYDKAFDVRKTMGGEEIRPDIIIHERGCNDRNIAFIEIKKRYRSQDDINKCRGAKEAPYKYQYSIIIDRLATNPRITIFKDTGEMIEYDYPMPDNTLV